MMHLSPVNNKERIIQITGSPADGLYGLSNIGKIYRMCISDGLKHEWFLVEEEDLSERQKDFKEGS